jgi:hypothetical protein
MITRSLKMKVAHYPSGARQPSPWDERLVLMSWREAAAHFTRSAGNVGDRSSRSGPGALD